MVKSALKNKNASETQKRQLNKWVKQAEELDGIIKQEKLLEESQGIANLRFPNDQTSFLDSSYH
jgi:hypothetical protein